MQTKLKYTLLLLLFTGILSAQISYKKLHKLVKNNNLDSIQKLIDGGLNINAPYRWNSTLLHIATEEGKVKIVKYLVEKGANLNLQNKDKNTPLLLSTSFTWRNDSISEILINNGADLNSVGLHGSTALRNTTGNSGYNIQLKTFKLLLSKGVDFNFKCSECCNRTVFLYATNSPNTIEILQLLIDKKVDINQQDCNGLNALMYAIENKNIEAIKLLIKNGIDLNHKTNKQKTAKDYALASRNEEIINLFEK